MTKKKIKRFKKVVEFSGIGGLVIAFYSTFFISFLLGFIISIFLAGEGLIVYFVGLGSLFAIIYFGLREKYYVEEKQ